MPLNLPTLAEISAERAFKPQPKGESRKAEKRRKDREDATQLDRWRASIWQRDEAQCQCCHIPVIKWNIWQNPNTTPPPNAGECHHLVGRSFEPLRVDVRNGVLVCHECHQHITHHEITVTQSVRCKFTLKNNPKLFMNANKNLQFHRKAIRETR